MALKYPELFQPFHIGKLEIKNKIVMSGMHNIGWTDAYDLIDDCVIDYFEARAKGGVGFYTPTGVGTVVEVGKEKKVIYGRECLLELPLHANVALFKAQVTDTMGNAIFRYTASNFNPVMAMAADLVILETEQLVAPGEIEPDRIMLPGIFVDHVVLAEEVTF